VVQHEGGGTEIISPDDPSRHIKRRKKKVLTARPSSAGAKKRPRDPPPPPDGAAGTSRPTGGHYVRLLPGVDYPRPHPREGNGGRAGQRGRERVRPLTPRRVSAQERAFSLRWRPSVS
jgi:hypothetical protein